MIIVLMVFFSTTIKSQQNTIFKEAKSGETVKVIFDVSNYTPNHIGEFKDELISYENLILKAHYDENSKLFTLLYNDKAKISLLIDVFTEYQIEYNIKESHLNSH